MRANFPLLLLASLFVLANFSSAAKLGGYGPKTGEWSPIKNLSDPHVAEIGEYAVSEHNKEANSKLALSRVIKGETQVVAGLNYRLVLETKDGGKVESFEAIVLERAWEKALKLTSFKPIN